MAAGAAGEWDGAAYGADAEYVPDGERVIRVYNFADLLGAVLECVVYRTRAGVLPRAIRSRWVLAEKTHS
jgi:hypothetical protein